MTFARTVGNAILGTIPRLVRLEMERLRREIDGKGEGRPRSMMPDLKELEEGTAAGDGSSDAKSTTAGAADASSTPPLFIPTLLDTAALASCNSASLLRAVSTTGGGGGISGNGGVSALLHAHVAGTFRTLSTSYLAANRRLLKLEKRCETDRLLQGGLSEGREKGLTDARLLLETLAKSAEALSDALDVDSPVSGRRRECCRGGGGKGIELWTGDGDEKGGVTGCETRAVR